MDSSNLEPQTSNLEKLSLIRPVLIKALVTENYKKDAVKELLEAARQTELKLQHLDYQEKKLTAELTQDNAAGLAAARQRIGRERLQNEERHRGILLRIQEVQGLLPDTEVVYGKMESLTEIKVGDEWRPVLGVEIILRDGVITAIRQPEAATGESLP